MTTAKISSLPVEAPELLRASAVEACNVLKVLGNPDRLLLLCQMMEVERNVSELEVLTGVSQPTLSQQLAILRAESLVQTRREGKNIYYTLENPKVSELMHALYQIFCNPIQDKKS